MNYLFLVTDQTEIIIGSSNLSNPVRSYSKMF